MRDKDGEIRCGACERRVAVEVDLFVCRECMDKLPASLRREVLNAEEPFQYAARRRALEALGVALIDDSEHRNNLRRLRSICGRGKATQELVAAERVYTDSKRINFRTPRERSSPRCTCAKPLLMKQSSIFGGEQDVCGNCCKRINKGARRVMA